MQQDLYINYFKNHYRADLTNLDNDIKNYSKWFGCQFDFIRSKFPLDSDNLAMLEIGSSYGGFYSFLNANQKKKYTGIEVDNDMVLRANDYWKTTSFINTSIEDFDERKAPFDCVLAFEVLEHLDNPISAIKKIKSLLNDHGAFIGTSPFPYVKNIFADQTHRYVLHPRNWQKVFLDAGFTSVQTYPMSFIPYLWRLEPKLNVRIPFYIPINHVISTTLIIAHV